MKESKVQTEIKLRDQFAMYTKPVPKPQRSTKTQVVPGQAMSLSAIAYKLQNNIPVQASARQVESFYRNLDLVDRENLQTDFEQKASQILQARENYKQQKQKEAQENAELFKKFKESQNQQSTTVTAHNASTSQP